MDISADVYGELRALAARFLRRERRDHTHQPTSLANEAVLRLGKGAGGGDRDELVRHAARVMRQVLVDHARQRLAAKRGGGARRVGLPADAVIDRRPPEGVVAIDEALRKLEAIDPELAEIVGLRYFGNLGEEEAARHLGVSVRTVSRRWQVARLFLARELSREEGA